MSRGCGLCRWSSVWCIGVLIGLVSCASSADVSAPGDRAMITIMRGPFPPRTYACRRTSVPIVVDGVVDAAWSRAPWSEPFVDIEGSRRPAPRHQTTMAMMWDDEALYIIARMDEPHLWATYTTRDSVIYHENDFEVFIDPDGDTHNYTEIEVNALNTVWDLLLVKPYRNGGPAIDAYDIVGLRTAVGLEGTLNDPSDVDRGWIAEFAIPWTAFADTTDVALPPNVGDRWRMNFSRVQWRIDPAEDGYIKRGNPVTGTTFPEDNWVWSPQRQIAMHEPEFWGIVEFDSDDGAPFIRAPSVYGDDRAAFMLREWTNDIARAMAQPLPYRLRFSTITEVMAPPSGWDWPPALIVEGAQWRAELHDVPSDGVGRTMVLHHDGRCVIVASPYRDTQDAAP
ncbi:MAG: carbohydrate-binding family 9-like protein [Phycisphaerales bacterium]|nr:carbohydrate-binding family 9-like protein [Phycisphaerales bacterium]